MRLSWKAGVAFLGMALAAPPVAAGIYSDDLAKCMVKSSNQDDQLSLVRWIFAAMTLHPAIQDYANMSPAQRAEVDGKSAALVTRLLTVDCRAETVAAVKYEGPSVLENAFRVLGEVAMRGLVSDPKVTQGFESWGKALDEEKLGAIFKDAGLTVKQPEKPAQ